MSDAPNNRHGRQLFRSEITRMSTRWCWTLNNPEDWRPDYASMVYVEYAVHQLERGQEGTFHLQGYVRLNTRKQGSSVKAMLGNERIHLEVARGTEQQNRNYCTKDDTRIGPADTVTEYQPQNFQAEAGKQGKRSDLEEASDELKQGLSMHQFADKYPHLYIRYHRGFQAFASLVGPAPARKRDVSCACVWGPTGTGKTHWVLMHHQEEVFMVSSGRDPWNSYSNQAIICFDEFNDQEWPITTMNKVLDCWKFELDRRYENRQAAWRRVIICSNSSPLSWYPNAPPLLLEAFRRRIQNNCYYFPTRGCQPETEELLETLKDHSCNDLVQVQLAPDFVPASQ